MLRINMMERMKMVESLNMARIPLVTISKDDRRSFHLFLSSSFLSFVFVVVVVVVAVVAVSRSRDFHSNLSNSLDRN